MRLLQQLPRFVRPALAGPAAILAFLFGYLMSAGPAYYISHRYCMSDPALFRFIQTCYQPTDWLALRQQRYWNYLHSCASKGVDAGLEEWGANQSLHSTPR